MMEPCWLSRGRQCRPGFASARFGFYLADFWRISADFCLLSTPIRGQNEPSGQVSHFGFRAVQTRRPCWIIR